VSAQKSSNIRRCRDDERAAILGIVNAAAEAYRAVIPRDRWQEPYMPADELEHEITAGVVFWGYEADGTLAGVMGLQAVRDVDLVRHAYVRPGNQRRGIGGALLAHLRRGSKRRMLVGTWAAADWAITFYQRRGFELVSPARKTALLAQDRIAQDLLEHPGSTDRDIGGAGQSSDRRAVRHPRRQHRALAFCGPTLQRSRSPALCEVVHLGGEPIRIDARLG
jgi:GNAT superfamily N-acetyltransferase